MIIIRHRLFTISLGTDLQNPPNVFFFGGYASLKTREMPFFEYRAIE